MSGGEWATALGGIGIFIGALFLLRAIDTQDYHQGAAKVSDDCLRRVRHVPHNHE